MIDKPKTNIGELLKNPRNRKYLKVAAPMVRYSRLEFRSLVRRYGAELTFTPMTIANSFCRSEACRQAEFSTNEEDSPIIVQFASNSTTDFLHGTEMIQNFADGVDLNCGCPQSWAMQDGYGSYLLKKPEVIEDMVKTVRRNVPSTFSVSVKVRLLNKDLSSTIDFCRKLETLNPTFITIHGRTPYEKTTSNFPVDVKALAEIKKSLSLPIIFNGDVTSIDEAEKFYEETKCDGMMAARALLTNPALFDNHQVTPLSCVQDWINIHHRQGDKMTYQNFHHHLVFMMEHLLKKHEKNQFHEFTRRQQCLDFLKERFAIEPQLTDYSENLVCTYNDTNYKNLISQKEFLTSGYSTESSHGQYFLSKLHKVRHFNEPDDIDCSNLFN